MLAHRQSPITSLGAGSAQPTRDEGAPAPRLLTERSQAHLAERSGGVQRGLIRCLLTHASQNLGDNGVIDSDSTAPDQADPARWLRHLSPAAVCDLRRIIDAPNAKERAEAVQIARAHGRGWRDIATALALNEPGARRTP